MRSPLVGVMGAGCIGQFIGAHLQYAGLQVRYAGRSVLKRTEQAGMLRVTDVERPGVEIQLPVKDLDLVYDVHALADCDIVFVCLKCNDIASCGPLSNMKAGRIIISLQNGVNNTQRLRELLPHHTVVAGMVPYGVNEISPGHFRRGTFGPLAFEDTVPSEIQKALKASGLGFEIHKPVAMEAVMWGKLIINLQNAPNALVGLPLSDCVPSAAYRQVMTAAWKEGLQAVAAARIPVDARLNGKPLSRIIPLMRAPNWLYSILQRLSGVKAVDRAYRSSMWTDLDQRRHPEIDDLNLKIVNLAKEHGVEAPVNKILSELILEAAQKGEGAPNIPIQALFRQVQQRAPGAVLTEHQQLLWWGVVPAVFLALLATWGQIRM